MDLKELLDMIFLPLLETDLTIVSMPYNFNVFFEGRPLMVEFGVHLLFCMII